MFSENSECQSRVKSGDYYVYFNAYCVNDYLDLSIGFSIKKSYIPVVIGLFDAVIVLIYIFMLISLGVSQRKAVINVLHNSLTPALYSLELANLPKGMDKETLIVKLWDHIENGLNHAYRSYNKGFRIVDIQVAQKNSVINFLYKKGEIIKKVRISLN